MAGRGTNYLLRGTIERMGRDTEKIMNAQIKELLLRIPSSPETDELQNVLEKQDEMQRAELMELRREKRLLAMLASEAPEFYNPLHAMEAVTLRDAILKHNADAHGPRK